MGIAMDLHCLVPDLVNTPYHMAAGRIFPYGGSTAPDGYLMCDGAAVSRTTYKALFDVIGTTFGAGDGSTTFNVPDLRSRVPVGLASKIAGVNENLLYTDYHYHAVDQYHAYRLYMTQNLTKGQTYTLQLWDVDVSHAGKSAADLGLSVFWGGGSVSMITANGTSYFTNGHADYLKFTFTAPNNSHAETGNAWLVLWNSVPNVNNTMRLRVGKWKLEAGSEATAWQPRLREAHPLNRLGSMGGETVHHLVKEQSGLPAHGHGFTQPTVNGGATTTGGGGGHGHEIGRANNTATQHFATRNEATKYGAEQASEGFWGRHIVDDDNNSSKRGKAARIYANSVGNHTHGQVAHTHSVSGGAVSNHGGADASWTHNNMPPYVVVNYIISIGGDYTAIKGDPGVSIESITEQISQLDGGENIITVRLSDGSTHDLTVYNGNTGTAAGFGTPTATVDSNVGTPSVTVTATGPDTAKEFAFEFSNLKGVPAGFGTPTATVGTSTGTPSVSVTASGDSTEKVFSFAFDGLKGAAAAVEDFLPIAAGLVYPYAGSVAPEGYLLCDGTAYDRIEYSDLFAVIGTTYGDGDGSTTFNVPDYRGRTLIGSSTSYALGTTGGAESVTLETAQIPSHNHPLQVEYGNAGSLSYSPATGTYLFVAGRNAGTKNTADNPGVVHNVGGGQAHNNMQPYAVANYVISTGAKYAGFKGETGDVGNVIHIGTDQPAANSAYVLWYNPFNGSFKAKCYVEPDAYTDGGWAWRELTFADIGKNGDVYTATVDNPSS